jgi:hypothetical protein
MIHKYITKILNYKYELMWLFGGIASIATNSSIAIIVHSGGLFGMIAKTVSPAVDELKKAFKITYKDEDNDR